MSQIAESPAAATADRSSAHSARAPAHADPNVARWSLAAVAVLAAAGILYLFWPTLSRLPYIWDVDPNYSHGYIVPILALVFAVRSARREKLRLNANVERSDVFLGSVQILLGLLVHAACLFLQVLLFDVAALLLVLGGTLLIVGGRETHRALSFPLVFLIFMAPLPTAWYEPLAIAMQQLTASLSALVLEVFQVPVHRVGYFIHLPDYTMEVGAACSGLRQLGAILALSLAIGHVGSQRLGYKVTLGLLSVPIAIAANCVRVVLTGFILMWFGREWADGIFHTLEGMATVAVATGLLLVAALLLKRFLPDRPDASADEETA